MFADVRVFFFFLVFLLLFCFILENEASKVNQSFYALIWGPGDVLNSGAAEEPYSSVV